MARPGRKEENLANRKDKAGRHGLRICHHRPKTGESYSYGPDTQQAREQRLWIIEAYKRLDEGDEEAFHKLMMGEDPEPWG